MKRLHALLAICLLLMGLSAAAAETAPVIVDDADLLTDAEEAELYREMTALCEYGTPMFWTHQQSGSYDALAKDFYYHQIGNGRGMLLVINMYQRQLTIVANGGVERILTHAENETITDNIYRAAGAGRYLDAARSAFDQMHRLLRGEEIARPMKTVSNVLLAATLALLAVYLYISQRYEQHPHERGARTAVPVTVAHAVAAGVVTAAIAQKTLTRRRVTDISSDSGGGEGGSRGGGFSGGGGGGGGGGFSGGSSGSHGF